MGDGVINLGCRAQFLNAEASQFFAHRDHHTQRQILAFHLLRSQSV